jgi:hypothetical protein
MSDWGKGVINNIGWGQGANNDIGWGSIYDKSNAGETLLIKDSLNILENSAYVFSLKELVSSNDDKFAVRRTSDDAVENYKYSELIDGTLKTFGASSDVKLTSITDITGNKTLTQSDTAKQFNILSNGDFYKGVFETGVFRSLFNQDLDLGNFAISVVFNCDANDSKIISYTEGNNDSTYLLLLERNGYNEIRLRLNIIGTGTQNISFTGNLNLEGRNVITTGVKDGDKLFYKINNDPIQNVTLNGSYSMDKVDEDIGGRNQNSTDASYSFFKRFATPPNDELITKTNNYLIKSFDITNIKFIENVTVVPDDEANTGLSYDKDNDELIISNWNNQGQNRLLRYDRETLTQVGVINVNEKAIQSNTKIGDIYYIGDQTLNGYDVNGNTQGSITLPVAPDGQCMVTFFNGHIYTISNSKLVKISFPELQVVSELEGFNSSEGLAVNEKYVATGDGDITLVRNYNNELLVKISSNDPEGICFDTSGNLYTNKDEGFKSDIPDGNKLWKYSLKGA